MRFVSMKDAAPESEIAEDDATLRELEEEVRRAHAVAKGLFDEVLKRVVNDILLLGGVTPTLATLKNGRRGGRKSSRFFKMKSYNKSVPKLRLQKLTAQRPKKNFCVK